MNGGDMTLAFELEALRRLASPGEAVADARQWTNYVGVVSDAPTYEITNYTRQHRIRQDFFSGPQGREESLANIREQFDTGRHVLVTDAETASDGSPSQEWEVLTVTEAAAAADWELDKQPSNASQETDGEDRS
jgi:hypothetical protein